MYRGRDVEPISFPQGFNGETKEYTIHPLTEQIITVDQDKTIRQTFRIKDSSGGTLSVPVVQQIIAQEFPDQVFEYHNFVLYKPIDVKEEEITNSRYPKYKFRDIFNYRPPAYIEYISKNSELDIPNFYLSLRDETNFRYDGSFSLQTDLTTRDMFLDTSIYVSNKQLRNEEAINRTKTILLNKDANQYKQGVDLDGDNAIDVTSLRNLFPFAINMNFDFVDQNYYTNAIDDFKLHQSFLDFLINQEKDTINLKITDVDFENIGQPTEIVASCLDFDDYLSTLFFKKYYDYIILPGIKNESIYTHNIKKFESNLYFQTTDHMPADFHSIKQKKRTPSELLYLKVEKYLGQEARGEPLQTFYMSGNSSTYEYYDTQVKNKKYYTYKITGIFLSSGVNYRFTDNNNGTFTFEAERSRKIIEYPVLTKTIYVLQPLPLVPDVYVYKDKNKNKVYFYLRLKNEHTRYVPFEPISENDNIFIDILNKTKQYEDPEHGYVTESAKFEIYKTTTKPSKLSDLRDSFLLETRVLRDKPDHLFIDHIEYEQDYYYLFRAINNENFPGNPTKLFKVRMQRGVEENKLQVEMMNFLETPEEYAIKKNFNKLFHIFPRDNQNIMTNLGDIGGNSYQGKLDQVDVGLDTVPKVWGKKFKMRITSNNTGKKMDFNVKFSIKRKTLETE